MAVIPSSAHPISWGHTAGGHIFLEVSHQQFQEEKKLVIQYILDTHKLSNGAKAENVNVGPGDN